MAFKKQVDPEYAGKLAEFGNLLLDGMANTVKERTPKVIVQAPARCPSCGETRLLVRGFAATICQECHDGITELAKPGKLWK